MKDCGISGYKGQRILEIGSGNGDFLQLCHEMGMSPSGLEVLENYYNDTRDAYPHLDCRLYDGREAPFGDNTFDYIVSFQVLEHVSCLPVTLGECVRILKPGGIMYHVIPNYQSFYEGHYKIIWLPFLTKGTGRAYLKALGRYTPYYETLNLVKPGTLKRLLSRQKKKLEIISYGRREFIDKFNPEQISKTHNKLLKRVLQLIYYLPVIKKAILHGIALSDLYYPLTLIAKKRAD
ncbi:MAG: class I SAM-dependent methyltransferase [Sedimentisphaerales bacterium]|nr:class I SAM-dependent methyltransferase [Sedimentisphaerales bacterium]